MQVEAGLLVAVVDVHPRLQMGDVLVIMAVSNTQCSVCIKGSCTSFVKETSPVRRTETVHGSQESGHLVQKEPGSRSSLVGTPGQDVESRLCVL